MATDAGFVDLKQVYDVIAKPGVELNRHENDTSILSQPVLHFQVRNFPEMSKVCRYERTVIGSGDGSYL